MENTRQQKALKVRIAAAELAVSRPHPRHIANGDEQKFRRDVAKDNDPAKKKSVPSYLASFTKGMPHVYESGLVKYSEDFQRFVKGIDSGDPRDFKDVRLGPEELNEKCKDSKEKPWKSDKANTGCGGKGVEPRAWESQGAGNTYDLEGPDAQAVTMPPAPKLGSDELIAEIAEVYAQALLRDVAFTDIAAGFGNVWFGEPKGNPDTKVDDIIGYLNDLKWFKGEACCTLTPEQKRRRGPFNGQTVFRGITPGDRIGPYISQFLLAGNAGINNCTAGAERSPKNGYINYGGITADQRVRFAKRYEDHMTTWDEWYDVQQGADMRGMENYESDPPRRFITTPRDMATYVHFDALYESYLNACLILMGLEIPFDPGIPFQGKDLTDHQQGFAHFGGPHILSLLTEVATRALKAVRFQKFNIHRRLRPEALAARFAKHDTKDATDLNVPELEAMLCDPSLKKILNLVAKKNGNGCSVLGNKNYLLPMAFCEGSPMHPSYGAGHATVAGACVTILKAFFDHHHPLAIASPKDGAPADPGLAFVAKFKENAQGSAKTYLEVVPVVGSNGKDSAILTVEGELNKLASNIAIGRDWAGVHYFTDYIESLRMGEQVALGILEEQKLTYGENFSMTVPLFDGGSIRI